MTRSLKKSSISDFKLNLVPKIVLGMGCGEVGKWGSGEVGKWGSGEVGKWGVGRINKNNLLSPVDRLLSPDS
ncbi:hypothetical protein [Microcystis aeruginosa]|uniref:hypothetical protein n=1 Tax=Microcystis aeruginosa TaxID=1126 RepID=UPI0018EF2744